MIFGLFCKQILLERALFVLVLMTVLISIASLVSTSLGGLLPGDMIQIFSRLDK